MRGAIFFPFVLSVCGLAFSACEDQPDSESVASRGGEPAIELRSYDGMPDVQAGTIYVGEDSNKGGPAETAEAERVLELMRALLGMLDAGEIRGLERYVSSERGLYVDLKAHRTRDWVAKDLQNPTGYLQTYYINTEALRSRTEDPGQLAVRDILRLTRVLTADVYLQADGKQCELRLRLEDAPSKSYYLNNPVFRSGKWRVVHTPAFLMRYKILPVILLVAATGWLIRLALEQSWAHLVEVCPNTDVLSWDAKSAYAGGARPVSGFSRRAFRPRDSAVSRRAHLAAVARAAGHDRLRTESRRGRTLFSTYRSASSFTCSSFLRCS